MNPPLDYRDIWLIGGGGKTTLMFTLAAVWASLGERVICTTTTRIWKPTPEQCSDLRIADLASIKAGLRERPSPMTTVASRLEGGKCLGFSADDTLSLKALSRRLIVEADGSAGRPVKAHLPHEPVVAAGATCVVAVVGGWCIGAPLDLEHVHRPEQFSAISGRALGTPVTPDDVACVILHENGWIRAVPPDAAFHVVVTGDDRGLISALAAHPLAKRLAGIHRA